MGSLWCVCWPTAGKIHTYTYVSFVYYDSIYISRQARPCLRAKHATDVHIPRVARVEKKQIWLCNTALDTIYRYFFYCWIYCLFVIYLDSWTVCANKKKKKARFIEILPGDINYNCCKNIYNRSKKRFKIITLEKNRFPVLYLLTSSIRIIRVSVIL